MKETKRLRNVSVIRDVYERWIDLITEGRSDVEILTTSMQSDQDADYFSISLRRKTIAQINVRYNDGHWNASSKQVAGLAVSAESVDEMMTKLRTVVPDLCQANDQTFDEISVQFIYVTELDASPHLKRLEDVE